MVVFEFLHLVSGLVGLGSAVGLFLVEADRVGQLVSAMWVGLVGVLGTGVVLSLSGSGSMTGSATSLLFAKVVLSVALLGVMYWSLPEVGEAGIRTRRNRLALVAILWAILLVLGVFLVA